MPKPDEAEAEAQKPDLRLPIDAIKAANRGGGTKPLIDHVRKPQGKRRDAGDEPVKEAPGRSRERPGRRPEVAGGEAAPPVQRGRRGPLPKKGSKKQRRSAASSGS